MGRPRTLLYGVGINDADYMVHTRPNGKKVVCPYYAKWANVIQRAASAKFKLKHPRYKDTTVCGEWLYFMTFRKWMASQNWHGKAIDKDIIFPGNQHYSPETCCFVEQRINNLVLDCSSNGNKYPLGVGVTRYKKFVARLNTQNGNIHLGHYDTPEEAGVIFLKAKAKHLIDIAAGYYDPRISEGLNRHASKLLNIQLSRGSK